LRVVRDLIQRAPSAFGHALCALDLYLSRAKEVAVVGDPSMEGTKQMLEVIRGHFRPHVVLGAAGPGDQAAAAAVPLLAGRTQLNGRATAYVCEGFVCRMPVTDPEALASQLQD